MKVLYMHEGRGERDSREKETRERGVKSDRGERRDNGDRGKGRGWGGREDRDTREMGQIDDDALPLLSNICCPISKRALSCWRVTVNLWCEFCLIPTIVDECAMSAHDPQVTVHSLPDLVQSRPD